MTVPGGPAIEPARDHRDVGDVVTAPAAAPPAPGRSVIATIGIDRYGSWHRLAHAVSDARGARAVFHGLGFQDAAPPIYDEQATAAALQALVTDDLAALGQDDRLVVFFAGHGGTHVHELAGEQIKLGYLIPVDGARARDKLSTWIDLGEWLRRIAVLPPRHILVIIDACRAGIALHPVIRWRSDPSQDDVPAAALQARRSRRIITSALDDQLALDSGPVHGHSLFTGCLIEALSGGIRDARGMITGSAIGLWVQDRVRTYPSSRQTPDFGAFDLDDRGEMAIAWPAAPPPAGEPESAALPPVVPVQPAHAAHAAHAAPVPGSAVRRWIRMLTWGHRIWIALAILFWIGFLVAAWIGS